MREIVGVLYRELHYRRLRNNPQIASNPEKFRAQLRRSGDIRRGVATQSLIFLFLGFMMAGAILDAKNEERAAVLLATYALLPFVMALYTTTVNASYVISMGIFEPLKPLPIKTGAKYLSALLAIDNVPAVVAMLPVSAAMIYRAPIPGFLSFLWVLVGTFLGHTLGLLIYTTFRSSRGRLSKLKTAGRVVGVFLFLSIFYAINYVQVYVNEHYEELLPFFTKYSVAYPFSVASIVEPLSSSLLLLIYLAILIPIYLILLGRLWESMEVRASSGAGIAEFRAKTCKPVLALAVKDLKIVTRKTPLMVGLLFPLFIILPSAIGVLSSGRISGRALAPTLLIVAWMASTGIDAVLKIDGPEFEFLRSLPLTLPEFLGSKLIVMNIVPVLTGIGLVLVAARWDSSVLVLLPAALVLPLLTSSVSVLFVYWNEGDLSVPETDFGVVFLIMLLNGLVLGSVTALWFLAGYVYGMLLATAMLLLFMWRLLRL